MHQINGEITTDERPLLTDVEPLMDENLAGPKRRASSRRRPHRLRHWVVLVILLAAITGGLVDRWPRPAVTPASPKLKMFGTVPYWNLAAGSQSVIAHRGAFAGVSPWIYRVDGRGGVVLHVPSKSTGYVAERLAELQNAGVPLMPTISNAGVGVWNSERVSRIINDPARRARHVQAVVDLVEHHGFAGVDIDYEELRGTDRAAFSAFIVQLAGALHAKGKKLSVDVFAKTTDRGYDQRNVAQDYAALGNAADQIRIMAYDWHWSSSAAGPIAPLDWVKTVLDYAVTQIPRSKVVLGIPMYGYDWVGKHGQVASWLQAYERSRTHDADMHWDHKAQSPWFTYQTAQGEQHTVWFENAYSSNAKIALAKSVGVGGVYLWLAGDEDDLFWHRLPLESSDNSSPSGNR